MANISMRRRKDGSRVFDIRVMVDRVSFNCAYPKKKETPIPPTWSDARARKEAEKVAALFEDECKHRHVSNDKRTFTEYMHYVIDLKSQILAPSTIDSYKELFPRIEAARFSKKKIKDITVKDLNVFYLGLLKTEDPRNGKTLCANTVKHYHNWISSVFKHACKEEVIVFNPTQNVTLPKVERKVAAFYTPEQIHMILNALEKESKRCRAVLYLCIGTGMRRGEISGLKWSDIDFKNRVIRIQRSVTKKGIVKPTKTNRERSITVEPDVLNVLQELRQEQNIMFNSIPIDAFCFAYDDPQKPEKPDSINRLVTRFKERNGITFDGNTHAYRHTQASIILQDGDIMMAQNRLGHSRASTTLDFYGHMMPQTDVEASRRIGEAFFRQDMGK